MVALFMQDSIWHPNISVISSSSGSFPNSRPLMIIPQSVWFELLRPPLGSRCNCNESKEGRSGGRHSVWSTSWVHYHWCLILMLNILEVHTLQILWRPSLESLPRKMCTTQLVPFLLQCYLGLAPPYQSSRSSPRAELRLGWAAVPRRTG